MSVISKDTADHRTEKAIAAYIRGYRDLDSDDPADDSELELTCSREGDLFGVHVYEGRQTAQRTYPSIVVSCPKATRIHEAADWYTVETTIELYTHRNEAENDTKRAEVNHAWRSKALEDLMCDPIVIMREVNAPVPPEIDSRDVQNITIMGVDIDGMSADIVGSAFLQRWEMTLYVAPWDAE